MSEIIYSEEETKEKRQKHGLEYGGAIPLHCDSCGELLIEILITRPNFKFSDGIPLIAKYKAKCCYCDGFSQERMIQGGIALTSPSYLDSNGHEKIKTFCPDFKTIDDIILLNITKVK